jgi:hypothetical protein
VPKSEHILLLVIDVGRISLSDLPKLNLQILEELTETPAVGCLGEACCTGCSLVHEGIVLSGGQTTIKNIRVEASTKARR